MARIPHTVRSAGQLLTSRQSSGSVGGSDLRCHFLCNNTASCLFHSSHLCLRYSVADFRCTVTPNYLIPWFHSMIRQPQQAVKRNIPIHGHDLPITCSNQILPVMPGSYLHKLAYSHAVGLDPFTSKPPNPFSKIYAAVMIPSSSRSSKQ
jgi:hypothetical protein